jgi:hypothetical protein
MVSVAPPIAVARRRSRRAGWYVLAVLVVVAAAAVISDLPTKSTGAYKRQHLASFLAGADSQIAQCRAGAHDALEAYTRSTATPPTASHALATTFVQQAIPMCSFADAGVVDLGTLLPDRSISSPAVDRIAPALDAWAYLGAFDLLQDLKSALADPGDPARVARIPVAVAAADSQRSRVEALVESAERAAGAAPVPLPLVRLAPLLPAQAHPDPGRSA